MNEKTVHIFNTSNKTLHDFRMLKIIHNLIKD